MSASISATDWCRQHPSDVDGQVRLFYFAAVNVRDQESDVIPLSLYLNVEKRLIELSGFGSLRAKPLTAVIVNRAAQLHGSVNISWSDVSPIVSHVCGYFNTSGGKPDDRIKQILTSSGMKGSADWVKNFASYQAATASSNPSPSATPSSTPELTSNNTVPGAWTIKTTAVGVKNKSDYNSVQAMVFDKDFAAIKEMLEKGQAIMLEQGQHIYPIRQEDWAYNVADSGGGQL